MPWTVNPDSGYLENKGGGSGGITDVVITTDDGTATFAGGIGEILGGPGVTVSGTGDTVTVNSVIFNNQGATANALSDNGYFATAAITLTLPASPSQGELIEFVCTTSDALIIDAPSTHLIRLGSLITSAGGTVTSTAIGDSLILRYREADTTWYATAIIGTWLIA